MLRQNASHPTRHHDDAYRKKHKDSGGQRYEDTLFFNRMRKQAKWVFVLLDRRLRPRLRALRRRLLEPRRPRPTSSTASAAAARDALGRQAAEADAEEPEGRAGLERPRHRLRPEAATTTSAIPAWVTYTGCARRTPTASRGSRPTTSSSSRRRRTTPRSRRRRRRPHRRRASGRRPRSPLGRALGSTPDPIGSAVSQAANTRFNDALSARQATATHSSTSTRSSRSSSRPTRAPSSSSPRRPRTRAHGGGDRRVQALPQARAGRPERGAGEGTAEGAAGAVNRVGSPPAVRLPRGRRQHDLRELGGKPT